MTTVNSDMYVGCNSSVQNFMSCSFYKHNILCKVVTFSQILSQIIITSRIIIIHMIIDDALTFGTG